jgi:hypothetical protein
MRTASPRINIRVFTALLIVGLLMLTAASAFVLGIGAWRLRSAYGANLAGVADQAVAAVDAYVFRRIIDASIFAKIPDIRDAAVSGNKQPFDATVVRDLDRQWTTAAGVPESLKGLFATRASSFLAEVSTDDAVYRELFVTDRFGRVVAASHKISDYYQADEEWWKQAFGGGVRGRLNVSDVSWDESAKVFALEIDVPVMESTGGALAGVLKVIADIREIGAVVGGVHLGTTGEANLLREDGSFVFSRGEIDPNARYFATDLLQEHLQAVHKGEEAPSMSFAARGTDGTTRLIGAALSQLKTSYPELAWVVAVSQDEDELFAPVRAQWSSLVIVLALTALAVVLMALYVTVRLAAPPPDSELHLVEHAKKLAEQEMQEES